MIRKLACSLSVAAALTWPGPAFCLPALPEPGRFPEASAGLASRVMPAEELVEAGANTLAELRLQEQLPGLRGTERQKALYLLGLARKRRGDNAGAELSFERMAPGSCWFVQATSELADLYAAEGKLQKAATAYRKLIGLVGPAESDLARLKLADVLFFARRYLEALAAYQQLENSSNVQLREAAWFGEGWCATRSGNHPRAIAIWDQVTYQFPTSSRISEAHLLLANHFLRMGNLTRAYQELNAVSVVKDHAAPFKANQTESQALAEFVGGEAAAKSKDWVRALAHYQAVGPNTRWSEPAAYGLAWAKWQSGQLLAAQDAFEAELRSFPTGSLRQAALYGLGRVQQDQNLPGAAMESYRQVLSGAKSIWAEEALYQLARLELKGGHVLEAERWASRLCADYPAGRLAAPALWVLAEAQLAAGLYTDAINNYGRLAQRPETLDFVSGKGDRVLYKLGLAYFRAKDYALALSAFARVTGRDLADEARFWLAESQYHLGRFSEAAANYRKLCNEQPPCTRKAEATYGLAWALLKNGDKTQARFAFGKASQLLVSGPLKRDAYYRLSLLNFGAGHYDQARESLKQLMQLPDGPDQEAAYLLALSQLHSGQIQDAVAGFKAIADQDPTGSRAQQARRFQAQGLLQTGQLAEAGAAFEELSLTKLTESELCEARSQAAAAFLAAGKFDRAAALYRLIDQDASASTQTRLETRQPLAHAYLLGGAISQAEQVLAVEASGDPWTGPLLLEVAEAYGRQGKWREAAATYGEVPGNDPMPARKMAWALVKAGDWPNAAAALEALAARQGNVDRAGILGDLANLYGQMEVLDQERSAVERLEAEPGAAPEARLHAWMAYGERASKKERIEEAVRAFRVAQHLVSPNTPMAWQAAYRLAGALVAAGRYEDAIAELSNLVARAGKQPAELRQQRAHWRSLALLKQAEAHEGLRQWDRARSIYAAMTKDSSVEPRERQEATIRLAWIEQNVPGMGVSKP